MMKALRIAIAACNDHGIERAGAGGLEPPPGAASCSGCHAAGDGGCKPLRGCTAATPARS